MSLAEIAQRNLAVLKEDSQISELLGAINQVGSSLILGGAIRDWYHNLPPKDIDIVIDCSAATLASLCKRAKKNAFGGYKVVLGKTDFDIWNLEGTWALNNDTKFDKRLEVVPRTVFFNMDAIAYRLDNDSIIDNGFAAALESKVLDIIYEPNPYPFICVSKALIMLKKYSLTPSQKLRDFVEFQKGRGYNKLSFNRYQKVNYGDDNFFEFEECMKRI